MAQAQARRRISVAQCEDQHRPGRKSKCGPAFDEKETIIRAFNVEPAEVLG